MDTRSRLQADDAVGHLGRPRQIVGDDERASARRFRAEQRGELCLPLRIDAAGRLVEHEQVGLGREHGRQREPLALADREIARMPAGLFGQPELRERCARARVGRSRAPPRPPRAP